MVPGRLDPFQQLVGDRFRLREQRAQVAAGFGVDPSEAGTLVAFAQMGFDPFPKGRIEVSCEVALESIEHLSTFDSGDFPIKHG